MKALITMIVLVAFTSGLFAETITIERHEYDKLLGMSTEYLVKLASKTKIELRIEKTGDYTIKAYLYLAKDLEYADDFIYSTTIHYNQKIKSIAKSKTGKITIELEGKIIVNSTGVKVKWFLYGVVAGAAAIGITALIKALSN